MINKYGSRKFIISLMALGISTWALFEILIDADTFRSIVISVIGLYGAANVSQKVFGKEPLPNDGSIK